MKKHLLKWVLSTLAVGAALSAHATLPELTTDTSNPKYYLIQNTRAGKYAVPVNETGKMSLVTLNPFDENLDDKAFWYFTAAEGVESPEGWTAVNIWNKGKNQMITNPENMAWTTTASEGVWYINNTTTTQSGQTGHAINKTSTISNSQGWNNFQGGGNFIAYWQSNDEGSTWLFVDPEASTEPEYTEIKNKGDEFASLTGMSEAKKAAWEAATSTEPDDYNKAALRAITDAYNALLDGTSFTLTNVNYAELYMVPNGDNFKAHATDNADKRIFTFHKTSSNTFNVLHEYNNKYLKSGANKSNHLSSVAAQSEATEYTLKTWAGQNGYAFAQTGKSGQAELLHCNGSKNIVNWENAPASRWYITVVSEEEAATEHLTGAQAFFATLSFGEGIGTYSIAEADKAAVDAALAVGADASVAEKRAAANTLRNVNLVLNPPTAGFYRFKGAANDKYMSSTVINDRMQMTTVNNGPETVFYYDGTHLAALTDGLVLGKFIGSDQANSWKTVLSTNAKAATPRFTGSETAGCYIIEASDNRHIHNAGSTVNCGDGTDDGYRWEIQKVQYLPIPGSDQTFTTICSPVALDLSQKPGITASKAEIVDGKVSLTALQGSVIPANTPVVLHLTSGAQRDSNNHLAYLMIVDGNGENPIPTETGLNGNTLAIAKEASHRVLSNASYVAPSTDYTPGFCAYLTEGGEKMEMNFAAILDYIYSGKIYNIMNSDTAADRGYLRAQDGQESIWTSKKAGNPSTNGNTAAEVAALAKSDVNFHWTILTDSEGNHYLYNLGVNKFAAAFKANNGGGHAEFSWHFADAPTAVNFINYDWTPGNIVNILGGQNNHAEKGNRLAGMMVINGNATPVPCVSGAHATTLQDGNGFIFTEVAGATLPADLPTAAQIAEAKAEMTEAHDKFAEVIANGENIEGNEVGYFDSATLGAYITAFQPVAEDDAEAKYYAYVRAQNAVTPTYKEFEGGGAYHLYDSESGLYYRAAAEKMSDGFYELYAEPAPITSDDLSFNWRAEIVDGKLKLKHTFQAPADSQTRPRNSMRRANEFADFDVHFIQDATAEYDGQGNITLTSGDTKKTLRANYLGGEEIKTTAIREIEAANEGNAETIYDLQGRRLNRALRGINIINGKKVLVK